MNPSLTDYVNALFGEKLAKARKSRSLTQQELAERLNVSRVTIANIERGKQNVQLAQAYSLAQCLNASPADLLPTPVELEHLSGSGKTPEDVFLSLAKQRLLELFKGSP